MAAPVWDRTRKIKPTYQTGIPQTMLKRLMSVSGAIVVGVLLAGSLAAPAHAGTNFALHTTAVGSHETSAGSAYFEDNGDQLTLNDNQKDGAGVVLHWWFDYERQDDKYWGGGSGTGHTFSLNLAEGKSVQAIVCLRDNGVDVSGSCSVRAFATS
jgi:hypothetical protein